MSIPQTGTLTCKDCGRVATYMHTKTQCVACYKRLIWRPRGGPAVERDRESGRKWKDLHRELNRQRDREYAKAQQIPCPACGQSMEPEAEICAACIAARAHERALEYVTLWAQGKTLREIAEHFGYSKSRAGAASVKYRKQGYELPYRYDAARRAAMQTGRERARTRRQAKA